MAPSNPTLVGFKTAAGLTVAVDAFTPSARSLLLLFGSARVATVAVPSPIDIVEAGGIDWEYIGRLTSTNNASSPSTRTTLWLGYAPSSPVSIAPSIKCPDSAQVSLAIAQVATGFGSIRAAFVANNSGDPNPSLSPAPDASSLIISYTHQAGVGVFTTEPLANELLDDHTNQQSNGLRYTNGSGPSIATWGSGNTRSVGVIVEVLSGSGAPNEAFPVRPFIAPLGGMM